MRFVLTSPEFVYGMHPRPGFPLILNDEIRASTYSSLLTFAMLRTQRNDRHTRAKSLQGMRFSTPLVQ